MLLHPYRFGAAAAIPPTIGTITPLIFSDAADTGSWTFTDVHTSATGHVGLLVATRSNAATSPTISSATWKGDALTGAGAKVDGVARGSVWGGHKRAGQTGLGTVVITASATAARDLIGYIFDLSNIDAADPIGNAPASVYTGANKGTHDCAFTIENANSLAVALVACYLDDVDPMTGNGGWTIGGTDKTGNGGTGDIAAVLAYRVAGATGALAFTATKDGAAGDTDDWGNVGLEFLPT